MTSYEPKVQCHPYRPTLPPPIDRCKMILDTMRATAVKSYWGNAGTRADVALPKYLRERQSPQLSMHV